MSQPEGAPTDLSEMLDQVEWYRDSSSNWWRVAEMSKHLKEGAAKRLIHFALPMARNVFRDVYAYAMPSGEQAQIEVERGEAEIEVILESVSNARDWMRGTALYEALSGERAWETWEPPETPETASQTPYEVKEQASRENLSELEMEILRLEQAERQIGMALTALRVIRNRML
jgi:hypothetical protein